MDIRPILIDDVVRIPKKKFTAIAEAEEYRLEVGSTESKEIDGIPSVNYYMYLEYNDDTDEPMFDFFTITLSFSFHESKKFRAKLGFYVKSASFVDENDCDVILTEDDGYCYWEKAIFSLTDVLNPEKKFIENGMLTLHMKGILFVEPSDVGLENKLTLGQILWERNDHDFIIFVGKDDKTKTEVRIHKLILASRSPVFDAMLQTDMKEKAENRLEIIDFDVEVVQTAVEYFYDRDTYKSLNLGKLISLLKFADKYDIKDMKAEVEHSCFVQIYPKTICQISNASLLSNSSVLKKICIQTMIIYLKQGIPFVNSDSLDKDFTAEMVHTASSSFNL
uniref:BTB domain-containing protein n=1 Tax=Panagrolaimus sp. ES5 TaxID=591445 RepID=A0AC34EZD3_9BILA